MFICFSCFVLYVYFTYLSINSFKKTVFQKVIVRYNLELYLKTPDGPSLFQGHPAFTFSNFKAFKAFIVSAVISAFSSILLYIQYINKTSHFKNVHDCFTNVDQLHRTTFIHQFLCTEQYSEPCR